MKCGKFFHRNTLQSLEVDLGVRKPTTSLGGLAWGAFPKVSEKLSFSSLRFRSWFCAKKKPWVFLPQRRFLGVWRGGPLEGGGRFTQKDRTRSRKEWAFTPSTCSIFCQVKKMKPWRDGEKPSRFSGKRISDKSAEASQFFVCFVISIKQAFFLFFVFNTFFPWCLESWLLFSTLPLNSGLGILIFQIGV